MVQLSRLWASLIAQLVKNPPAMQETWFNSLVGKICWRIDTLPNPVFLDFLCGLPGKESSSNVGGLGLITFIFLNCRGPGPVDPGKFEGETALANTLALIRY